jgi:hypothetical protein
MTQETKTISEARQRFEATYKSALAIFTASDRQVLVDWLEQGDPNFGLEARFLMFGLAEHQGNFSQPIPKDLALIAAKLFSKGKGMGQPADRKEIRELLAQKIGNGGLKWICFEGFEGETNESGTVYKFTNPGAVQTDLANKVDEAVTEFLAAREAQKPAAEAEEEPAATPAVAEEAYNGLNKARKKIVDIIVANLMAADEQEKPALFLALEVTPEIEEVIEWLDLKLAKPISKKDAEFFDQLPSIIKWRIGEEKNKQQAAENRERLAGQVKAMALTTQPGNDFRTAGTTVTEAVKLLIKEAGKIALPGRNDLGFDAGTDSFGRISLVLPRGWNNLQGEFKSLIEIKPWQNSAASVINSMRWVNSGKPLQLTAGFSLDFESEGKIGLKNSDRIMATVQAASGNNQVEIVWSNGVTLEDGLKLTGMLGKAIAQGYNLGEFPALRLDLPAAGTSSSEPEVVAEEEAPAEEEALAPAVDDETPDWVQELGQVVKPVVAAPAEEPPVEEPTAAKALAGKAKDKVELPAWLTRTKDDKAPGGDSRSR